MDAKAISGICEQVYRKYPEVKGSRPKLQPLSKGSVSQHVLIFTGKSSTETGRTLSHTVRVVVNAEGKILKMSSSKS